MANHREKRLLIKLQRNGKSRCCCRSWDCPAFTILTESVSAHHTSTTCSMCPYQPRLHVCGSLQCLVGDFVKVDRLLFGLVDVGVIVHVDCSALSPPPTR